MRKIIDKLFEMNNLTDSELKNLIENISDSDLDYLNALARKTAEKIYGKEVFIRGLIEFTSYCKNNCYYCGLRAENSCAERYRLSKFEILSCCEQGYSLGFRTFVLQGGEDMYYTDERLCEIISEIRNTYPDCAITLSVGEKKRETYLKYFKSGANRFLLRHETADKEHYRKLHPENMSLESRMKCLKELKEIGFQTGCGFMVGSPYQTTDCIVKDLRFIKNFKPEMVGIGPFLSHKDTPFFNRENGSVRQTLILLSIIRLLLPEVLLPATTALGTASCDGRERGILAGANVVMPNLSPVGVRKKYLLYDNKISTKEESAQCVDDLRKKLNSIGYNISISKGDNIKFVKEKNNYV